jgi:hypothetical protein
MRKHPGPAYPAWPFDSRFFAGLRRSEPETDQIRITSVRPDADLWHAKRKVKVGSIVQEMQEHLFLVGMVYMGL